MLKMSLGLNNTQRGVTQRGEKKECIGGGAERASKCGGKVTERERTGKMERRRQKRKKNTASHSPAGPGVKSRSVAADQYKRIPERLS